MSVVCLKARRTTDQRDDDGDGEGRAFDLRHRRAGESQGGENVCGAGSRMNVSATIASVSKKISGGSPRAGGIGDGEGIRERRRHQQRAAIVARDASRDEREAAEEEERRGKQRRPPRELPRPVVRPA